MWYIVFAPATAFSNATTTKTGKFADVSKNVRFVGTEFDTYERGDLAELVRIIQEREKEKLRLVW